MSSGEKISEGIFSQPWAALLAIFITLFTLIRSVVFRLTHKFHNSLSDSADNIPNLTNESLPKEEFRPPSPAPALRKKDLLSSALKKLSELEEKVDKLQAKPFEMPCEKEELLNAAVYRVDALEADLIATKKVILSHLIPLSDGGDIVTALFVCFPFLFLFIVNAIFFSLFAYNIDGIKMPYVVFL